MKILNYEDFQKRVNEVNKAAKIFSPLTNNVSEAFKLYQEVLAEERMEIFVSTVSYGNRPLTPLDDFVRPKCPDCNSDMLIRPIPRNDEGTNTQLVCSNDKCDTVLDSQLSIHDWLKVLEKK